ncbi:heterokaryon incompatibility protein-domain-containing protein [Xylariales sp. PMI_506]|nr:heterokaryon incompatibility protein-domain-containing protein [Xylariales sp. PMI_506]
MSQSEASAASEISSGSDHEIVQILRSQGNSEESTRRFLLGRKRLRGKTQSGSRSSRKLSNSPALCHCCRLIDPVKLRESHYSLSRSFKELRASSATCRVCSLFLDSLRRQHVEIEGNLAAESTFELRTDYNSDGISDYEATVRKPVDSRKHLEQLFQLSMDHDASGLIHLSARVRDANHKQSSEPRRPRTMQPSLTNRLYFQIDSILAMFTSDVDASVRLSIPLDTRPHGDEKIELIKEWIKLDIEAPRPTSLETVLRESVHESTLPSRVIYLGVSPDLCGQRLQLINTREAIADLAASGLQRSRLHYVTLSHRWGRDHSFTTTTADLETRQQEGFTFEELPETYRDAAAVTAKLGFHYLWIDAICIVQDDEADWIHESELMGGIYRSAAFTIATHCSENDDDGFLARALRKRGAVQLNEKRLPSTFIRPRADLELDVSRSPLCKRGWVLQERFLSRRILHFTPSMIYWETTKCTRSEDGMLHVPVKPDQNIETSAEISKSPGNLRTLQLFQTRPSMNLADFERNFNCDEPSSQGLALEWSSLVEIYSTCNLTQDKDKLVAISGIAQILQQKQNISYLAGIWADHLPIGLWWLNVGNSLIKSSCSRAPSWSWAAWNGPIQFPLANKSLEYQAEAEFISLPDIGRETWLNGPGVIRIRTHILDISWAFHEGLITISSFAYNIFEPKSYLWQISQRSLWNSDTDPNLRLFDASNARTLYFSRHFREQYRTIPLPNLQKSWCVLEKPWNESSLTAGQKIVFASMAHFRSTGLRMVLILQSETSVDSKFRRMGIGVIRDSFLQPLRMMQSTFPHSKPVHFVEGVVDLE